MDAASLSLVLGALALGLVLGGTVGLALGSARRRAGRHGQGGDVAALLEPIAANLSALSDRVDRAERSGVTATAELRAAVAAELQAQGRAIETTAEAVRRDTQRLRSALGRSEVRGRWGEAQLRRVIEAAGMVEHVHFTEQATIADADGTVRPDLVIHLADGGQVVVDAKVPLDAILAADSTDDADDGPERAGHLDRHARQVAAHIDRLGSKAYWSRVESSPAFVVMFLPAESLLGIALDRDPSLLERSFQRGVVLATPTTFLALLRTVSHGWRQDSIAREAREIHALGRDLHVRLGTLSEHLTKLGSALDSAVSAYNRAIGSLESRVLVSARRFVDLGVVDEAVESPPAVTSRSRSITAGVPSGDDLKDTTGDPPARARARSAMGGVA